MKKANGDHLDEALQQARTAMCESARYDHFTERQVCEMVAFLVAASSVRDAATKLRVSPAYVQAVAAGNLRPGPKLLKGLGLTRHVLYTEKASR